MTANSLVTNCVILILTVLCVSCGKQSDTAPKEPSSTVSSSTTQADFKPLLGQWARTDGNYTLELRSIAADGKTEAAYFNPNPINVSRAESFKDGDKLKLIVELRDSGYPGCLYKLTFDKATDQLLGTYLQAAMNETYEIAFTRVTK